MNLFLILTISSVLLCLGTSVILFRKRHIAEILTLGVSWFFCSNIFSTMLLFLLDNYFLERGMKLTCLVDAIVFVIAILVYHKVALQELKEGFSPEKELKVFVIPLLIAIIGLPFVSQKNELFGMGQDEGVYQCVAINFMNDYNTRQQDFHEYQQLDSDIERENFQTAVHNKLVGYDIPDENYPDTVYDREVSDVSGIYHGIPTYASLLAMWGKLMGMEHMADIQTVFYVLAIFLICFVCENLKLKASSKLISAVVMALSPVVIWVAKSSLTEMFLAVLLLLFLYFLTDEDFSEEYIYSIIPIAVFSCYHVSIYTLIPYVMIIYAGMYFFTKRKIFSAMLLCTILGYVISYLVMRQVQPFYTMNNYRFIFSHIITIDNLSQVIMIAGAVLIILCMVYILLVWKLKNTISLEEFLVNRASEIIMQVLLICLIALPLLYILIKAFSKLEDISALTLVGFVMNTGVLLIPLGIIFLFVKPKIFLQQESTLVIFVSFFYCVLIYSAFLRFEIEYYYYYSRYLVPFVPIAILFAVTALDKFDNKIIITASAVSVCVMFPYSEFLSSHKDDTRMEWNVLQDITDQIENQNTCIVMENEVLPTLWLPVRAITKASVFPAEKHLTEQVQKLSERYETVYVISMTDYTYQLDSNLEILYRNIVHGSEDENSGELSTMPMNFTETEKTVYVYQYLHYQTTYTAEDIKHFQLYGIEEYDTNFCWTNNQTSAIRCILPKKNYNLILTLHNELPITEMKREDFFIRFSVNGILTDMEILTIENNQTVLTFRVPQSCLHDGSNIISFQTNIWNASIVNPKDNRILGIPIESLVFEER